MPANCHTFWVFLLIFDLNSGFVTHSLFVAHFADLPSIFEEMPLSLIIFATYFHSYKLRGCEIGLPQKIWDSDHTFLKFFVSKSGYTCKRSYILTHPIAHYLPRPSVFFVTVLTGFINMTESAKISHCVFTDISERWKRGNLHINCRGQKVQLW